MADITLQQAQQMVDSWIKTYGVRYFNELTNMTILTEEVGELARIMARTYGEQSFKESDKHRDLGDEMADVLWVLQAMSCGRWRFSISTIEFWNRAKHGC